MKGRRTLEQQDDACHKSLASRSPSQAGANAWLAGGFHFARLVLEPNLSTSRITGSPRQASGLCAGKFRHRESLQLPKPPTLVV